MGTDKELRIRHILRSVDGRGYVSVRDLRRTLGVSDMTIRRDLEFLEDSGYLIRKHGGAVRSEATNNLFTFDSRVKENRALKEAVCATACISGGEGLIQHALRRQSNGKRNSR